MRLGLIASILLVSTCLTGSLEKGYQDQQDPITITVDSTNFRFDPPSVTISEGEAVRFLWNGELLPHNAVDKSGVFDSGEPSRNVDYSFTFETGMNGTYEYVCEPHEDMGMVGTITVEAITIIEEEPEPAIMPNSEETTLPGPLTAVVAIMFTLIPVGALALFETSRKRAKNQE
ncbi:MAG: hypothetical protein CMA70_05020 [Euryarchaeota archaeon]|jgi:plastocyanin|nr:hypothetical protein [Euryarchaeota archaeon]